MAAFDDEVQPFTLPVIIENLPPELIPLTQWVLWDWEARGDDWTKPLINPATFGKARSNSPATWAPFEKVRKAVESGAYPGLGFVLWTTDPYVYIDCDKCRNPETGEITPWALDVIHRFPGTYMEISPSGTGIKILIRGRMSQTRHVESMGPNKQQIEVYERKYTTLTGQLIGEKARVIFDHQEALECLERDVFGEKTSDSFPEFQTRATASEPIALDDEAILAKARTSRNGERFVRLYDMGDISAYDNNPSRADQALCNDPDRSALPPIAAHTPEVGRGARWRWQHLRGDDDREGDRWLP